jgi:hypothetical protein
MNELTELKRLAELATPGPWCDEGQAVTIDTRLQICCGKYVQIDHETYCCGDPDVEGEYRAVADKASPDDAAFIAAANPAVIIKLLDRIEALERMAAPKVSPALVEELDWCIENGNVGPRTHKFLVSMRAALAAAQKESPAQPTAQATAPEYRGYAHLGTGNYLINHSASGELAELIISIATEEQRAGRVIGDERDTTPGAVIQPDVMCVRIRFENAAGLAALEKQIRYVREVHFAGVPTGEPS